MSSPVRRWPFFIFVLLGIAAVFYLKQHKPPPVQNELQETSRIVRYIEIPSVSITPHITGHGSVRPVRVWEAVSQVKGKVVEKHPRLQKGAIIKKGELLLQMDPTDYELTIARIEADIAAVQAQLTELEVKEQNGRASLAIEQQSLKLIRNELERKKDLVGRGGISASDVEGEERALLSQRQKVLAQDNTLNLMPSQRGLLEAQLARHQTSLDTARRDLQHTRIEMPFSGRIAQVNVELDQYVREGEVLSIADDLALAEVEAQFPLERFAGLIRSAGEHNVLLDSVRGGLAKELGLTAQVRIQEQGMTASWDARFARISDTLDLKTRTIGVIVEVEKPYEKVQPGIHPPLLKGMFVEVELSGKMRPDSLVVPRHALLNSTLNIITKDNRLEIRKVDVAMLQPEYAVIATGVVAGERLVISDLIPAIEGMLLDPALASGAAERLMLAASQIDSMQLTKGSQ